MHCTSSNGKFSFPRRYIVVWYGYVLYHWCINIWWFRGNYKQRVVDKSRNSFLMKMNCVGGAAPYNAMARNFTILTKVKFDIVGCILYTIHDRIHSHEYKPYKIDWLYSIWECLCVWIWIDFANSEEKKNKSKRARCKTGQFCKRQFVNGAIFAFHATKRCEQIVTKYAWNRIIGAADEGNTRKMKR